MGGDHGPTVTVPASLQVLEKYPDLHLILVGNGDVIRAALADRKVTESDRLKIHHASQTVEMDELPSHALRNKKDSSMRVAIDLVKEGKAQACVSAGNTGALMATARFVLKTLPGVDRPAIMAALPTLDPEKDVHVLDLGANVDSTAENLFQFAVMGSVFASAIENIQRPKVALLNVGEEEIKGNEQVKRTAQLLSETKEINYVGYVEGDKVFAGNVDVVICDGFVGNIALKASEGIARLVMSYLKKAFTRTWYTRLVAMLAKPMLNVLNKDLEPAKRNGASLLGLQGIVIKSHGGANVSAFINAIEVAIQQVEKSIPERIHEEVALVLQHATEQQAASSPPSASAS